MKYNDLFSCSAPLDVMHFVFPSVDKSIDRSIVFNQMIGSGAYVLMWEYDSLTDFATIQTRFYKDEEWMKFSQELMLLIEPATLSMSIWKTVIG